MRNLVSGTGISTLFSCFVLLVFAPLAKAQSVELMPGSERFFLDFQALSFFDEGRHVSVFTRARATAEYRETSTDLFSGAYLNYTTSTGIGGSVIGRIASNSSGVDAGIHFFKANGTIMIFALPSVNINKDLLYSWFSIFRYTPALKNDWKLYSSLELFSAFGENGHLSSVQRIRLGLDFKRSQFGAAINMRQSPFSETDINPGIFIRKQFN
ncbi:MAG: hypothetical protein JJ975_04110 [Bacteroidia bacterium]|nr:hypothetical protein [Bacteroidia bacterium]